MSKTDFFFYSHQGARPENEDAVSIREAPARGLLAVIADGLGGHGGGAKASQTALQTVLDLFSSEHAEGSADLSTWLEKANREVAALQTPSCRMKTTMVLLQIRGDFAWWAHVGDSRLYHFVNGKLVDQTVDHSVSQMAVFRGEITKDQIRGHEDRNRLTAALGNADRVKPDLSQKVPLKGDVHGFLLCTDGFWEYVFEEEMEKALQRAVNAKEWMEIMRRCHDIRAKAGHDNHSAAAVIWRAS